MQCWKMYRPKNLPGPKDSNSQRMHSKHEKGKENGIIWCTLTVRQHLVIEKEKLVKLEDIYIMWNRRKYSEI